MQIHSVGIDLGKTTFHLVALGAAGKVVVKKKFTQSQLLAFTANMETSLIGLEACSGAHFPRASAEEAGPRCKVDLSSVCEAICEVQQERLMSMRKPSPKPSNARTCASSRLSTDDQLDLQGLHRVRDRLISRRTAVINQLRAFLLERGLVFAQTPAKLKAAMADVLENADANLTPLMRNLIDILWGEWKTVEQQIKELTEQLERISDADARCTRIRQIPRHRTHRRDRHRCRHRQRRGIPEGRDFAAWLGVVPRQYSTGGKAKLLGISKRGNIYLRKVLIHGARAAVLRITRDRAAIGAWLDRLDAEHLRTWSWLPWRISWHASCMGRAVERTRLQTLTRSSCSSVKLKR